MNRKKIAFVSFNLTSGGAERVFCNLANEFSGTYDVFMITIEKCVSFYHLEDNVRHLDCGLNIDGQGGAKKAINYFFTVFKLRRLLKENAMDLLIGVTPTVNVFAIAGCLNSKTKCIISEVNNPIVDPPNLFWKTLRNLLYNKSDCLISQTYESKKFFSSIMDEKKIVVLPNPLNPKFVEERTLPLNESFEKIILSVGRLDQNKAQDVLIRAFAKIPENDWRVYFLGDGIEKKNYMNLVKELGLADKVIFLGRKKDVANYYKMADIFVFTSRSEGLPNALIEAQFFGLPCISTDCPFGPSEIIEHNYNGFLIDIDDEVALEKYLIRLMADSNKRDSLSTNALDTSKKYEMSNVRKEWEQVFESYF